MMRLYTAETRIVRGMYMCYVCKYLCTSEQLQGRNFVVNASILLIFTRYQNNFNNDRNSDFEANISNIANVSKSKREYPIKATKVKSSYPNFLSEIVR